MHHGCVGGGPVYDWLKYRGQWSVSLFTAKSDQPTSKTHRFPRHSIWICKKMWAVALWNRAFFQNNERIYGIGRRRRGWRVWAENGVESKTWERGLNNGSCKRAAGGIRRKMGAIIGKYESEWNKGDKSSHKRKWRKGEVYIKGNEGRKIKTTWAKKQTER